MLLEQCKFKTREIGVLKQLFNYSQGTALFFSFFLGTAFQLLRITRTHTIEGVAQVFALLPVAAGKRGLRGNAQNVFFRPAELLLRVAVTLCVQLGDGGLSSFIMGLGPSLGDGGP